MALSKSQLFYGNWTSCGSKECDEWIRIKRTCMVKWNWGSVLKSLNTLKLNGSLDQRQQDGCSKPHAVAPLRKKFHDSRVLWDEVGVNAENGVGKPDTDHGLCNGEKIVVAVDVDEVLGSFVSSLNKFIAERYSSYHTVSEYYVYEFFRIWKCSRAEAEIRVHDFFKTQYFTSGIEPIPGSYTVLCNLSTFCELSVVTSRQNVIKDQTCHWIEKHYPGLFKEIHFGNHFALDGNSRPKSEICRSFGAQVLIDDNPRYALECAEAGIRVLLFDYHNSYPWCKDDYVESHSLVTKVHNWKEVQQHMISWTVA